MFQSTLTIFEGEDESELLSEFVKLSARWPSYDPITIARQVFRNLQDPELRAGQAALVWANDLNIKERIYNYRINGDEPKPLTKEQVQAKILATTEDESLSSGDKKVRLEGYKLYLESEGWVIKSVEKKVEDKRAHFPQVTQAVYAD